jgi:hypothetical protein
MKGVTLVEFLHVINPAKFHLHLITSLWACRGEKGGFPFEMHMALTKLSCAAAQASDKVHHAPDCQGITANEPTRFLPFETVDWPNFLSQ